ncbi:MAG: hypothetical protein P8I54_03470, partial [Flavobacteriaceae bacterium]|nr:hypothetical protein [Flavobacteriaceae bacterium]
GNLQLSLMGGSLNKAVRPDESNTTQAAFSRVGYGSKLIYKLNKNTFGLHFFYAKDNDESLQNSFIDQGVFPKENLSIGLETLIFLSKNYQLKLDYASSSFTEDSRSDSVKKGKGLSSIFFNNKSSTSYHKAIKTLFNYNFKKLSLGLGYERIDPNYKTLGAYYFNNDFENITVNFSTQLFDKINMNFNIGYQRDDLDSKKENKMNRTVGALNTSYKLSDKLNFSASYSNFSSITNTKPNQFDVINDDNLLDDDLEALNFKQLSQNANFLINYVINNDENESNQNINFNYALASVVNFENDVIRKGSVSNFHNFNLSHRLSNPNIKLDVSSSFNTTISSLGGQNTVTWGPNVNLNTKLFNEKLSTSFSSSYNQSGTGDQKNQTFVFRINSSINHEKKHRFNFNFIHLNRFIGEDVIRNLTFTVGYNYALGDIISFKL